MRPFDPTRDRYPEFKRWGSADLGDVRDTLVDDYLRRLREKGEVAVRQADSTASRDGRDLLLAYVYRAAARAVWLASSRDLVKERLVNGAIACVLSRGGRGDKRDAMVAMSTITDACWRTDVPLSEVVEEAANTLSPELSEGLRSWLRRPARNQTLSVMHLEAVGSGQRFRYRQVWDGFDETTYVQAKQRGSISPEKASPREYATYRDAKLPSARDLVLDAHVKELVDAGENAILAAARNSGPNERAELWVYSERAASRAVRSEDPGLLVLAGVALMLSAGLKPPTLPITMRVALVNDACERLGLLLEDVAHDVFSIAGVLSIRMLLGLLRREDQDMTVECMGFEASSDADGFRYRWVG